MQIIMFDMTRDNNSLGDYLNSFWDRSACMLEGQFSTALTENFTVLVIGSFLSTIEIDANYVPSTDY